MRLLFSCIKKKPRKASRLDTTRLFLAGGGIERSVDDTTVSIKVSACLVCVVLMGTKVCNLGEILNRNGIQTVITFSPFVFKDKDKLKKNLQNEKG